MTDQILMSEMTWVDYAERLTKPETVIYLPVGAVEQHGPHLPLGTDGCLRWLSPKARPRKQTALWRHL